MTLNSEVKLKYILVTTIICISLGVWLGYGFGPKFGPGLTEVETINYQIPESKTKAPKLPSTEAESDNPDGSRACIQIITPAKDPLTGEVRDFPTPCDVPDGWIVIENLE